MHIRNSGQNPQNRENVDIKNLMPRYHNLDENQNLIFSPRTTLVVVMHNNYRGQTSRSASRARKNRTCHIFIFRISGLSRSPDKLCLGGYEDDISTVNFFDEIFENVAYSVYFRSGKADQFMTM